MKKAMVLLFSVVIVITIIGCSHNINVATKDPIVIDIHARIDIYQHLDSIEDMVSGKTAIPEVKVSNPKKGVDDTGKPKKKKSSLLNFLISDAFAADIQDEISPELIKTIESRKARYKELEKFKKDGWIGENKDGFVEYLDATNPSLKESKLEASRGNLTDGSLRYVKGIVDSENKDREVIWDVLAEQRDLSLKDVKDNFAKLQRVRADSDFWIQVKNLVGQWVWMQKRDAVKQQLIEEAEEQIEQMKNED